MGRAVIGWLIAAAFAQEPASDAPAAEPADTRPDAPYEVTVWGEAAIRQARSDVARDFRAQGWRRVREDDGQVIFRGPERWMGVAILDYDGTLTYRRPVVAFQKARLANPVEEPGNPSLSRAPTGLQTVDADGNVGYMAPHPEATFWILPRQAVLDGPRTRLEAAAAGSLDDYRRIVEETARRASSP